MQYLTREQKRYIFSLMIASALLLILILSGCIVYEGQYAGKIGGIGFLIYIPVLIICVRYHLKKSKVTINDFVEDTEKKFQESKTFGKKTLYLVLIPVMVVGIVIGAVQIIALFFM